MLKSLFYNMNMFHRFAALAVLFQSSLLLQGAIPIVPVWSTDPNDGFNDPELGSLRRQVFQAAANYAGGFLEPAYSGEEIKLSVVMIELAEGTLGTGAPDGFLKDFSSQNPTYTPGLKYPYALANHVAGTNLHQGTAGSIELSKLEEWDYAIGQTPEQAGQESFYSTAIHEIVHSTILIDGNLSNGEYEEGPAIFDKFLMLGTNNPVALTSMTVEEREMALISGNVYFSGPFTTQSNNNHFLKMYAPNPYEDGSSIYHIDPSAFPGRSLLLYPFQSQGIQEEVKFDPVEIALFYDLGFTPARGTNGTIEKPILSIKRSEAEVTLSFQSQSGINYRILSTSALDSAGPWEPGQTVNGTGGLITIPVPANAATLRFYQVQTW